MNYGAFSHGKNCFPHGNFMFFIGRVFLFAQTVNLSFDINQFNHLNYKKYGKNVKFCNWCSKPFSIKLEIFLNKSRKNHFDRSPLQWHNSESYYLAVSDMIPPQTSGNTFAIYPHHATQTLRH